jgi:hypothetical protein
VTKGWQCSSDCAMMVVLVGEMVEGEGILYIDRQYGYAEYMRIAYELRVVHVAHLVCVGV